MAGAVVIVGDVAVVKDVAGAVVDVFGLWLVLSLLWVMSLS